MICSRCLERSPRSDSEAVTIYQGNALCHNCFRFQMEVEQGQMQERERRGFAVTDGRIDFNFWSRRLRY